MLHFSYMKSFTIALRLLERGLKYSSVGVSTYLLDLIILLTLTAFTPIPYWLAVSLGFTIGVTINFTISYYWVYKGTTQRFERGYVIFMGLAILSLIVVSVGTATLFVEFGIPLVVARTLMGSVTGTCNFLINTFFNFKLL